MPGRSKASKAGGQADGRADPRVKNAQKGVVRNLARDCAVHARATAIGKKTGKLSCWWAAAAGKLLEVELAKLPEWHWKPSRPAEYCKTWFSNYSRRHNTADAPRSGRRCKLPQPLAGVALLATVESAPMNQRYMNNTQLFKSIMETHNVKSSTIWRGMKKINPRLAPCIGVDYKSQLSDETVADRLETSAAWLRRGVKAGAGKPYTGALPSPGAPDAPAPSNPLLPPRIPKGVDDLDVRYLERIITIDAKLFYVKPKRTHLWGLKGTSKSIVIQDARVRKKWKVHYYAAVSYKYGGLLLKLVSGTQGPGYTAERVWQVGAGGAKERTGVGHLGV